MYQQGVSQLRRRAGSESESQESSYVVTSNRPSFQVTQEHITPHSSPNPRSSSRIPQLEVKLVQTYSLENSYILHSEQHHAKQQQQR